jgi:hypothetical protein
LNYHVRVVEDQVIHEIHAREGTTTLFLIPCLLRVFGVFSGYLVGNNHRTHGNHGINRNRNEPVFKVNPKLFFNFPRYCGKLGKCKRS